MKSCLLNILAYPATISLRRIGFSSIQKIVAFHHSLMQQSELPQIRVCLWYTVLLAIVIKTLISGFWDSEIYQ